MGESMTNEKYNQALFELQKSDIEHLRARRDDEARRNDMDASERRRRAKEEFEHARRVREEVLEETKAHYRSVETLLAEGVAALKALLEKRGG